MGRVGWSQHGGAIVDSAETGGDFDATHAPSPAPHDARGQLTLEVATTDPDEPKFPD
jgi:hypothetical protein